jgi:hypothetical protein
MIAASFLPVLAVPGGVDRPTLLFTRRAFVAEANA